MRHIRPDPVLAALVGAVFAAIAGASAGPAAKSAVNCAMDHVRSAEVVSIDERLDVTLTDGTVLKLAGIDPPGPTPNDPGLDQASRTRLSAWLAGREILFRTLVDRPDRWGRMPALAYAEGTTSGGPLLSVAIAVLDAGLGRFAPGKAVRPCRADFLAAEAAARQAQIGIWADPYYAVLAASDRQALAERTATSIVVEGKVIGLEAGRFRTTLLFGPQRGRDFSVTILQRNVEIFREAGLDLAGLKGKILRVRGLLDTRFGPQIEISGPDEIEVVAGDLASSPAPAGRSPEN